MSGKWFENNGPCSRDNEVKILKKNANWPKTTFRGLSGMVDGWGKALAGEENRWMPLEMLS